MKYKKQGQTVHRSKVIDKGHTKKSKHKQTVKRINRKKNKQKVGLITQQNFLYEVTTFKENNCKLQDVQKTKTK